MLFSSGFMDGKSPLSWEFQGSPGLSIDSASPTESPLPGQTSLRLNNDPISPNHRSDTSLSPHSKNLQGHSLRSSTSIWKQLQGGKWHTLIIELEDVDKVTVKQSVNTEVAEEP
jgi:hypothetical protein